MCIRDSFIVDSAGTHAYHVGSEPDRRSILAAKRRGVNIEHLISRQVKAEDFQRFDWLVVMDDDNRYTLACDFPKADHNKVLSMMQFAPDSGYEEVPDPYYGQGDGFELVLDLLEQASNGLFEFLTYAKS